MVRKLNMQFVESAHPIVDVTTKFGGQPIWLARPAWPLSRSTGQPMMFLGQIVLEPALFGLKGVRMAYLFISPDDVDGLSWEALGGENAVIIQPGPDSPPTALALSTGPALYKMISDGRVRRPIPCEYAVVTTPGEDVEFVPEEMLALWSEDQRAACRSSLMGNKIGGTPGFLQYPEFPGHMTRLLVQIDSTSVPFEVDFGSSGIGYVFISQDLSQARLIWQDT